MFRIYSVYIQPIKMEEQLELSIENLKCIVCREILVNPHMMGCLSECISCLECIMSHFSVTPEKLNTTNATETIARCICNHETVFLDQTFHGSIKPVLGFNRLLKNINRRCPNQHRGCSWFCAKDMSETTLNTHIAKCW